MILWRYRTSLGWLGIVLVLAQLLAPGVSHALRHADALRSTSTHALLLDLCSAAAPRAASAGVDPPPASTTQAAACGYCLHPTGHLAVPSAMAPDDHRPPAHATVRPLRVDLDHPAPAPACRHRPRAPPDLA